MRFFVVRFLICTRGVYSEIKVCFFAFFKMGLFGTSLRIEIFDDQFESIFRDFNFMI